MTEDKTKNRRPISEDLDRLLTEAWSKVVEYASIGAEEASRMSAAAKIRVDIETLRYRRGKLLKTLGERYFRSCGGDPGRGVDGTRETMRQISGLDRDIAELESDLAQVRGNRTASTDASEPSGRNDGSGPLPPSAPAESKAPGGPGGRQPVRPGSRRPSP